jgi:hypothetical protein
MKKKKKRLANLKLKLYLYGNGCYKNYKINGFVGQGFPPEAPTRGGQGLPQAVSVQIWVMVAAGFSLRKIIIEK